MPTPLHPVLVHFPIVLGLALPVLALVAVIRVGLGVKPRRAWLPVLVLALLTVVSAFFTLRSGEAEEDRVERIVPHDAIELHDGNAERFLWLAVAVLAIGLGGLAGGRLGGALRGVTLVLALVLAAQLLWTAQTGGALVYEHGAASAYTGELPPPSSDHLDDDGDD